MPRRARGTTLVAPPVAVTARSRSVAWLLMLLITVPFTAPFSTCDVSMLMSVVSQATSRVAIRHGERSTSIEEASARDATASVLEEEQFKDTILTGVMTVVRASSRDGRLAA